MSATNKMMRMEAGAGKRCLAVNEMVALILELAEDRVTAAVAEEVVVLVDPERGREDRVVTDQPDETSLDEVVQRRIERAGGGPGIGTGEWRGRASVGHGRGVLLGRPGSWPGGGSGWL